MTSKPRRKVLTNAVIDEVSTVDMGANQHAGIMLWKRDGSDDSAKGYGGKRRYTDKLSDGQRRRMKELMEKEGMSEEDALASVMRGGSRTKRAGPPGDHDDSRESAMDIEELQKKLGDLESDVATMKSEKASAEAERDALRAAVEKAGFTVEKSDDRVEVRAPAEPEYEEIGGEKIMKGSLPESAIALLRKQANENAELRKREEQRELEKRAETEAGMLSGEVSVRAALLKAVDGIEDEELRGKVRETLKAANAAHEIALREKGVSAPEDDPSSPAARIAELAKALFESGKASSMEAARAEVYKTEEGRQLRKMQRAEAAR